MGGSIVDGEVEPLPGLGRLAANNSAREAIRVWETFTSYFSTEGTVPWQDTMLCTSTLKTTLLRATHKKIIER